MNAHVHEKALVLFQELFNATTIFLQSRHFLLDVRAGPIKSKLPYMASTHCCDHVIIFLLLIIPDPSFGAFVEMID